MKVDYLIVGQGLAGSLLAFELLRAKHSVFVIDNPNETKASNVAAGVVNPIVFRRMTKSWLIDELYPQLLRSYSELENLLKTKLFYPMPVKKVMGDGESDFWQKKFTENELQAYISQNITAPDSPFVNAAHGIGTVHASGRVDLKLLVEKIKDHLTQTSSVRAEVFDFDDMQLSGSGVTYRSISARKVIFCEGHSVSKNPYFSDIQFKHTKGEVLRIRTKNYDKNVVLNKAMFLMPEGEQLYRLGATYDWNDLSPQTTTKARRELEARLEAVFTDQCRVVDQQAGIRPTTHDRRPVVGLHPAHPQVGIFNGLGSKGAMLGPYFARQLARFLCGEAETIHPEVHIKRYFQNQ